MKIAPDISEERVNELRTSQVIQKISNGEKECTEAIPQLQAKIEKIGEDINRK
jgi:ribosomal protein L7Ae-like RNA K-turn-binding protein